MLHKKTDNFIAGYNKILEIDPFDINSNYQLGFYFHNKNRMDQARKYFQKILDIYPSGYDAYLRKVLYTMNVLKKPDAKIVEAFTKSYELEVKYDYKGAIAALKDVYDEKDYDMNLRLGWLNYVLKQYTESINYYQLAIDLKPTATEPRLGLEYPSN